jgi:hypothetical protein
VAGEELISLRQGVGRVNQLRISDTHIFQVIIPPSLQVRRARVPNSWYPGALANKLAGQALAPGWPEIVAMFNSSLNGDPGAQLEIPVCPRGRRQQLVPTGPGAHLGTQLLILVHRAEVDRLLLITRLQVAP